MSKNRCFYINFRFIFNATSFVKWPSNTILQDKNISIVFVIKFAAVKLCWVSRENISFFLWWHLEKYKRFDFIAKLLGEFTNVIGFPKNCLDKLILAKIWKFLYLLQFLSYYGYNFVIIGIIQLVLSVGKRWYKSDWILN